MHLVDATLRLLEPLGIEQPEVRFDVPVQRELEIGIEQYVRDAHLSQGYVVINCGASCPARLWPAERFGRVARYLGEKHGLPSVVTWAGPPEAEMAARIIAKSGGHAVLAPDTSLLELAALAATGSSDDRFRHRAAPPGRGRGNALPGIVRPDTCRRSGPYGSQHYTIECDAPRVRGRRRRRSDDTAMRQISVEAVCEACDECCAGPHTVPARVPTRRELSDRKSEFPRRKPRVLRSRQPRGNVPHATCRSRVFCIGAGGSESTPASWDTRCESTAVCFLPINTNFWT